MLGKYAGLDSAIGFLSEEAEYGILQSELVMADGGLLMTEKEKMLAGMLYNANGDVELIRERAACKDLCQELNQIQPSQGEEQRMLLRKLLGTICGSFEIVTPFWCDYGYNISIGDNFFMNHNGVVLDAAQVTFGNNVFIGPSCGFYTAGHPLDAVQRRQGMEYARPITIGNDVWIGGGVQVVPGVTIGDNVVIGAGSVVTRDIPSGVVAAGSPCRVLRAITADDR